MGQQFQSLPFGSEYSPHFCSRGPCNALDGNNEVGQPDYFNRGHPTIAQNHYRWPLHVCPPSFLYGFIVGRSRSGRLPSQLGERHYYCGADCHCASYRINVEETALTEAFGHEYVLYSGATKRLIPGVY